MLNGGVMPYGRSQALVSSLKLMSSPDRPLIDDFKRFCKIVADKVEKDPQSALAGISLIKERSEREDIYERRGCKTLRDVVEKIANRQFTDEEILSLVEQTTELNRFLGKKSLVGESPIAVVAYEAYPSLFPQDYNI